MRRYWLVLMTLICLGIGGLAFMLTRSPRAADHGQPAPSLAAGPDVARQAVKTEDERTVVARFPDPNAPGTSRTVFTGKLDFDNGVYNTAADFTGPVANALSLEDTRQSIKERAERGLADWRAAADRLVLGSPPTAEQAILAIGTWRRIAYLEMYEGRFSEAEQWLKRGLELSRTPGVPGLDRAYSLALLGISAMRRGELENCIACVGPSSCIFPIEPAAVHQNPEGSRQAIAHFTAYLEDWPGDLQIRWLLNLAYMTLGEYPHKVPRAYLIPLDSFRSKIEVGRFTNVASQVGLTSRGPTTAGGSIFDDFTGDGLPDIFATSIDVDHGAFFFVNRGDGTFEDRSESAGVKNEAYALNLTRTDFDNDGNLDLLLLRGGWESPARLSLLRNLGDGRFEDVTISSGMGEPISSESAAWADYNNDGLVDVFVCGEYYKAEASGSPVNAKNHCRLYRNTGAGKFVNVADEAGVTNDRFAKGAVWGDYDNDGLPDLFVSNKDDDGRLYHNEGHEKFRDVTEEMGLLGPEAGGRPLSSFPCLFWDFDNDGWLDLFINDWQNNQGEIIGGFVGIKAELSTAPRFFRNQGGKHFRNVSGELGVVRPIAAMAINCGDIDNDGFLDLYFGTGWMSYSGLIPNVLLKNVEGRRFEDVTDSSRTGHLQKGHGISFADWDCDGDLDVFSVLGGGYPGDRGYSGLFNNPGQKRHWLKVKLVGSRTNRAALGARIEAVVKGPDGKSRSIHRLIGTNGSFGGNSLVELIGLSDSASLATLKVSWPTSGTTQTFHDLAADQFVVITEGNNSLQVLHQKPLTVPEVRLAKVRPEPPKDSDGQKPGGLATGAKH